MFLLPLYYQQLRGETVLHAGLLLIPQGVGSLAAHFVVSSLVSRLGVRLITVGSFLLAALATVPFALAGPDTSLWLLGVALLVRGFGIGIVVVPPMSVAYQDVPSAGIPHATMNTRIAQQVGASFGTAIVAVTLQSLGPRRHQGVPGSVLVGHRNHGVCLSLSTTGRSSPRPISTSFLTSRVRQRHTPLSRMSLSKKHSAAVDTARRLCRRRCKPPGTAAVTKRC
jgi:MFS family permease